MKISVIQLLIKRGDIEYNFKKIQDLIYQSEGELLVLPEYVLTGSLILDDFADIDEWIEGSSFFSKNLDVPNDKILVLNSLVRTDGNIHNCCRLINTAMKQEKVYPDPTELKNNIKSGREHKTFELFNKKFKIIICCDFKYWQSISTDELDFVLWVYHFTESNYQKRLLELDDFIKTLKVPVIVSSIVSDKNIGHSLYVDNDRRIGLGKSEGILEIELI